MATARQPGQRTVYVCSGDSCSYFSMTPGKCRSHPYPMRAMGPELVPIQMIPIEGREEPPYPADLLDSLAEVVALVGALADIPADQKDLPNYRTQVMRNAVEVLDSYSQEVGRENVPGIVAKAISELGG